MSEERDEFGGVAVADPARDEFGGMALPADDGERDEFGGVALSTPGAWGGAARSLQRGVKGAQAILPNLLLPELTRNLQREQSRAGIGLPVDDLRNPLPGVRINPARESAQLTSRSPEDRAAAVAKAQSIREVWAGVAAEFQQEIAGIPRSQAQAELAAAKDAGDKWGVFRKYPVQTVSSIVLESLPPSIAGAALGAPGGPAGVAAGAGLASAAQEFSGEFLKGAVEAGFDPSKEQELSAFLDSPAFEQSFNQALTRASIVGGVDAATAGQAGRFIGPALKTGLANVLKATGKEIGLQAGGGAGGEFLAQTATKGEQPYDWFDIAMEAAAEMATGPAEAISNVRQARGISDNPDVAEIERQLNATPPIDPPAAAGGTAGTASANSVAAPAVDVSTGALMELQAALRGETPGSPRLKGALPKQEPVKAGDRSQEPEVRSQTTVVEVPAALTEEQRAAVEFKRLTDEAVARELANPDKNYEGMSRLELELLQGLGDARAIAALRRKRARKEQESGVSSQEPELRDPEFDRRAVTQAGTEIAFEEQRAAQPPPPEESYRAESGSGYTIAAAVRDASGIAAPNLDEALREMAAGRRAAQVVHDFSGGRGEYDAVADILEQIHTAAQRGRQYNEFRDLAAAYRRAFREGGSASRIDQTLTDIAAAEAQGFTADGGPVQDAADLITRQWEHATGGRREVPLSPGEMALRFHDVAASSGGRSHVQNNGAGVEVATLQVGDRFQVRGTGYEVAARDAEGHLRLVPTGEGRSDPVQFGEQPVLNPEQARRIYPDRGTFQPALASTEAAGQTAGRDSRDLPRSETDRAVDDLNRSLGRANENFGQVVAAARSELSRESASAAAQERAWRTFEKVFRRKIIIVRSATGGSIPFQGAVIPGHPRVLFLNEQRANGASVLGHEYAESLALENPALFARLREEMRPLWKDFPDYLRRLNALEARHGVSPSDQMAAERELIADFIGDLLARTEFIGKLARGNPSLFSALAEHLLRWLELVKLRFAGYGADHFISDIERAEGLIEKALAAAVEQGGTESAPKEATGAGVSPMVEQGGTAVEQKIVPQTPETPGRVPARFAIKKPILGPTGAKIVAYEWRSTMGEKWSEREGGYVEARVSDWDNAGESKGTGREIVHVYYVEHPDGRVTTEGVRSAQNVLGISETRLQAIAKKARAEQAYAEYQEKAHIDNLASAAEPSQAEANRRYRTNNYSAMRSFEENESLFLKATLYEKDGKFVRTGTPLDLMLRYEWTPVAVGKTSDVPPSDGRFSLADANREINELRRREDTQGLDIFETQRLRELERQLGQEDLLATEARPAEDVAEEQRKQAQAAKIAQKQGKRLVAGAIEKQDDMFAPPPEQGMFFSLSDEQRPAFYSRLNRTVEQSPQGRASGAQWKATIQNSKLGANADEMALVGVGDLEDGKTYTKQEVLDYLRANEVVVKDVTLGKRKTREKQPVPDFTVKETQFQWVAVDGGGNELMAVGKGTVYGPLEARAYLERVLARDSEEAGKQEETHFSRYQLPGAKDGSYREVLLTVPGRADALKKAQLEMQDEFQRKYGDWSGADLNAEERARWAKTGKSLGGQLNRGWRDGHSQYSSIANPIVRLRFNERTTAGGQRMLFIEEVQAPQKGQFEKMPKLFQDKWRDIGFKWALRHAAENGFDAVGWTTGEQQAERYDLSKHLDKVQWDEASGGMWGYKNGSRVLSESGVTRANLADYIGKDAAKMMLDKEPVPTKAGSASYDQLRELSGLDLKVGGEGLKKLYDVDFRNVVNNLPAVKKAGQKVGRAEVSTGDKPKFVVQGAQPEESQIYQRVREIRQTWDGPGRTAAGWANWNTTLDTQATHVHREMVRGQSYADAMSQHGSMELADKLALGGEWEKEGVKQSIHSLTLTPDLRESVMAGQPRFSLADDEAADTKRTSLRGQIEALGAEMDAFKDRGEAIPQAMLDEYKERVDTLGEEIRSGRAPSGAGRVKVDENLQANRRDAETQSGKDAGSAPPRLSGESRIPQWRGAERLPGGRLKDLFTGLQNWRSRTGNWLARRGTRENITVNRDAADNRASQAANAASLRVRLLLNRAFDTSPGQVRVKHDLREAALTFVVEADGNQAMLSEFYDAIAASEHADTKAGRQALAALEYAETHWTKLQPAAAEYKALTETEREAELNEGVNSAEWEGGYVYHRWAKDGPGGGADPTKPAAAGTPFRKSRSVPTYAEGISKGRQPQTLNALELLAERVAKGQRKLNELSWVHGLRNLVDPATDMPVVVDVIKKARKPVNLPKKGSAAEAAAEAAGETYKPVWETIAPQGYRVWRLDDLEVAVQENFVGLLGDLTQPSFVKNNPGKKVFGFIKSALLMFDTFHLGRMVAWRQMFGLFGGYQKGQTLLDYTQADIREMAERGEIPEGWTEGLIENKRRLALAVRTGFNIGSVLDNSWSDAVHTLGDWVEHQMASYIPLVGEKLGQNTNVGRFNKWLFGQYQRGAMAEAWLIEFERMSRALPNLNEGQVARRVSKDLNARFGNLNRQGLFKSRHWQDIARFVFLAPQWNESLIRAELGAIGQALKAPMESAQQRRLVFGTLLRATGLMAVGTFLANQILNYAFRGKPTWENEEEGWDKKISAWIPDGVSGGPGLFLNPLALPMEYTHLIEGNLHRSGGDLSEALRRVAVSRLHAAARPAEIFLTRKDALGQKLRDGEVLPAMAKALLPVPIGAVAPATAAKQLLSGEPSEKFPGQYQKQMLASFGLKTDQAPSAEQRIRNLAREFNREQGIVPSAEFFAGDFDDLNKALRIGNMSDARTALDELLTKKTARQVFDHYQRAAKAPFTGQQAREKEFWRGLTEEQRGQYLKAREARKQTARKAAEMLKSQARPAAAR